MARHPDFQLKESSSLSQKVWDLETVTRHLDVQVDHQRHSPNVGSTWHII
jgi:hypothetical protein